MFVSICLHQSKKLIKMSTDARLPTRGMMITYKDHISCLINMLFVNKFRIDVFLTAARFHLDRTALKFNCSPDI